MFPSFGHYFQTGGKDLNSKYDSLILIVCLNLEETNLLLENVDSIRVDRSSTTITSKDFPIGFSKNK